MSLKENMLSIVGVIAVVLVIILAGVFITNLVIDNRDRQQHRLEQCLSEGYSGIVQQANSSGYICTGASSVR